MLNSCRSRDGIAEERLFAEGMHFLATKPLLKHAGEVASAILDRKIVKQGKQPER